MEHRIYFEVDIAAPARDVWNVLTEADQIPRWWEGVHAVSLTNPKPGGIYTLNYKAGKPDRCEILESEPGKLLRYRWHSSEPQPTTVEYKLIEQKGGCRLCFTNEGLGDGPGWEKYYNANFTGWLQMMLGVRRMLEVPRQ
jgi:uncharacterized protein YndB with AHSA1/START domain